MDFKANVRIKDLKPQTVLALIISEEVYKKFGVDVMVVTSCNDSTHKVGSKHYTGDAVDLRSKNIGLARQLVNALKTKLNPLGFDVIFEGEGTPNEHIHIEYDPKGA